MEKDTAACTADLQKFKFTNFYQMNQMFWELYSRECGEGLTDVKSDGAEIEKVWCAAAWYRQDSPSQCFIVHSFVYKVYFIVPV